MKLQRYNGNWAQCLAQIAGAGQRIATASEGMRDRIKQGRNSGYSEKGCWHAESFLVINRRIFAVTGEGNPLIPYAEQAVAAHRNYQEFYLTHDIVLNGKPASQVLSEIAEQDAKKPIGRKRVFDMGEAKTDTVPTDSLADNPGIVFLARGKKLAKGYGLFLNTKCGIPEVKFSLPQIGDKDYARGFWLYWLGSDGGSDFGGSSWSLDSGGGSVFGVSESAEGASQKILPYTPRQARQYVGILENVMGGQFGTAVLGEVRDFFKQK